MYGAHKAKCLFTNLKYHKFQAPISKWDVLLKNDQMLWIVKKPNEKASKICNHFWGRSYMFISIIEIDLMTYYQLCMTWLNWSLKLHSSTKEYSTFHTHTHHTRLLFNVCLFHLCDYTWSNVMCILKCLSIKPKKIFNYFICFWKCFYVFVF